MCLIELTGCVRSRYSLVGRNQELSFLGVGPAGYRAQAVAGLIHRDAGHTACMVDMFEYRRTGWKPSVLFERSLQRPRYEDSGLVSVGMSG